MTGGNGTHQITLEVSERLYCKLVSVAESLGESKERLIIQTVAERLGVEVKEYRVMRSLYECGYCEKTGSKAEIKRCEESHQKEREQHRAEQVEVEQIRLEAESMTHLAELCSKFLTRRSGIQCRLVFTHRNCIGGFENVVSNSHSAPINGVSNFSRETGKPLGYPGWHGNIDVHIDGGYDRSVGDACEMLNHYAKIHTGSGGSRKHGLGWDGRIYASDFPKMEERILGVLKLQKQQDEYIAARDEAKYTFDEMVSADVRADDAVKAALRKVDEAQAEQDKAAAIAREKAEDEHKAILATIGDGYADEIQARLMELQ
jgi:hypothetical protein